MRVSLYWIGKTRLSGVTALTEEYSKRITHYCDFHAEEIVSKRGGKKRRGASKTAVPEEELLIERSRESYRVVLDPAGKTWTSPQFARFVESLQNRGERAVSFCVGGADGFSPSFRGQASLCFSLSNLTLPHELARVVLLEQIYRAFTILHHHPYPR